MKLREWDIGTGPIAAPMAGISNIPYRLIAREHGATLTCAEFASSKGLTNGCRKTRALIDTTPADHPVSVQIFGSDPATMAEAARIVEEAGADILDINMGCPVKKIVKSGAGSALLNDPTRAATIVAAIRQAVGIPVTVKMRAGWESPPAAGCAPGVTQAVEVARACVDAGAEAVAVHPRTRAQGFSGRSAWPIIGEVVAAVPVPVIGNGDVTCGADAVAMLEQTGCAAVMVGRAAIGNPWVFRDIRAALTGDSPPAPPTDAEIFAVARQHLELMLAHLGEWRGVREYRKHLPWYVRGRRNATRFRAVMNTMDDSAGVLRALDDFFLHGTIPEVRDTDLGARKSTTRRAPTTSPAAMNRAEPQLDGESA